MKRLIGVIIMVLFLAGCSQGEPVELKTPYNVETAREAEKVAEPTPESRNMVVADAVIATITPTPTPETETHTPEPETPTEAILTPLEPIQEPEPELEPVLEPEPILEPEPEPAEELPTPADEFAYYDQTYLGTYTVTWYSREAVGYDAPGASGNGLVPYYSCAMPDYGLLNCTVLVEGYGYFHVDDVSDGPCDLYVMYNSEIPSYGMDTANVYIVG